MKPVMRRHLLIGTMLAPGLLVFSLLFAWPFVNTVQLSLQGPLGFSWENYTSFASDKEAVRSLALAGILSVACTALVMVMSLPLALIARKPDGASKLLQPLILLPLVMPPIISTFGLLIFWKNNGWFNLALVQWLGFESPVKITQTVPGLILFYVWLYLPYTLLNAISSVRSIDPAIENAARVAGATETAVFTRITLPLMMPGLWTGAILTFVMAFGAFTIPLIAGGSNRPLAVQIYTVATVFNKWNSASAMAIVMAVVQFAVLGLLLRVGRGRKGRTR